jgi:hypothetical protein
MRGKLTATCHRCGILGTWGGFCPKENQACPLIAANCSREDDSMSLPAIYNRLFTGANTGKLILKIA